MATRITRTGRTAPSIPDFDPVLHQRVRLGIVSALAAGGRTTFNDLTDGNLSVHARKLEEAGYVACHKFFDGRTPRTEYSLTDAGRRALERYLDQMEALLGQVRGDG